jgi:hypothetical protein
MPHTINGIGTAICGERKLTQEEFDRWIKYFTYVPNHTISEYRIGTESVVILLPLLPLKTYVFCYTDKQGSSKNYQIIYYPGGEGKIYWEHVKSSIIFYAFPVTMGIYVIWYLLFPGFFTGFNVFVAFIAFIFIWYIGEAIYNAIEYKS